MCLSSCGRWTCVCRYSYMWIWVIDEKCKFLRRIYRYKIVTGVYTVFGFATTCQRASVITINHVGFIYEACAVAKYVSKAPLHATDTRALSVYSQVPVCLSHRYRSFT